MGMSFVNERSQLRPDKEIDMGAQRNYHEGYTPEPDCIMDAIFEIDIADQTEKYSSYHLCHIGNLDYFTDLNEYEIENQADD